MPPVSTARGSAYLNALAIEIEKKLQRVCSLICAFLLFVRMFSFIRRCGFWSTYVFFFLVVVLTIDAVLLLIVQALASPSQMRDLLQELFADIALEVDDRAKGEFPNFQ